MICGIGTDIVEIARFERIISEYGDRFINKVFTEQERDKVKSRNNDIATYAKIYAIKEAVLKALGTGMRQGLSWQDIQTSNDELGKPTVVLDGHAKYLAQKMVNDMIGENNTSNRCPNVLVSVSDEKNYAVAYVIISV